MRSVDLVSESYGAPSQEPFDREQAALFSAMAPLAPQNLAKLIGATDESYATLVGYLDGRVSLAAPEFQRFLRSHLDLTSEAQTAFLAYVRVECASVAVDTEHVGAVLAEQLGDDREMAASANETSDRAAAQTPPTSGSQASVGSPQVPPQEAFLGPLRLRRQSPCLSR